ncbi:MAG: 16S rRNA (guanine(966)-N(2))-methyltransferase RsmD [Clostridiales bacterium]|nr:16S rRNA (guanine(966)-N(2))-methyltransferase RsmD [Clostridiales bacterium]
MMRVITGIAGGRRLTSLPGEDVTRPTAESVKEALFSMIQFEIQGKRILDLFAGTGQLGIEALSRGASICTFVENNKQAMKIVQGNVEHCRLSDKAEFVFSDAQSYLSRVGYFDIAFVDSPYRKGIAQACLPKLFEHISPDGIVACETSREESLPSDIGQWHAYRERSYGKTKLTLYRMES